MNSHYEEGRDAAYGGWPLECPYAEGTDEFESWMRGYDDAMRAHDDERAGGGPL